MTEKQEKGEAIPKRNNLTWFDGEVKRKDRERLHGHKGAVIWFTGLSASGKSTIAHALEKDLFQRGVSTYVFDGDNVRHGLCGDLGFQEQDRRENIRRIGEMGKLFVDAGIVAIMAFISPYIKDRQQVKSLCGEDRFVEVHINCPVEVCAARDEKGIYEKALKGRIKNFTGVSAPYEPPLAPDLEIFSETTGPNEAARSVAILLEQRKII